MAEFLRENELKELLASESDPVTSQLMTMANHILTLRVIRKEKGPVSDFDLRYFMEIIQDFAREHEALKKILDGRGDELIWMAEEPE